MEITYTLYCRECYSSLNETNKARPYNSYFICSNCGFETDRGYALQVLSPTEIQKNHIKKTSVKQVAFTKTF